MSTHDGSSSGSFRLTGVQCMVLSAFFFSLMSLTVKVVGQRIPTLELMFVRLNDRVSLPYFRPAAA